MNMHDFLHDMGQVIVALWQLGQRRRWVPRAWDFYALWVSRLTRLALIVVIGQPVAVVLVSLTGVHELTVLMALTPILALVFLMIVASMPQHQDELAAALAVTAGLSAWDRTARILRAILRGLLFFLLLDMAFGLYFSLLPIENDRRMVLWIVFMGVIFLLAVAVQPASRVKAIRNWMVGILLVGSAIAVFVLFPVFLLNGGWRETKSDVAKAFKDDAKAAPAAVLPSVPTAEAGDCTATSCTARIALPVNGSKSATVDIDAVVPDTWNYSFSGPPGTVVHWENFGDSAPIDVGFDLGGGKRGWGSRDGPVTFSAPVGTGGQVAIQSHPPKQEMR